MAAINPAVPFTVPLNQLRQGDFISVNGLSSYGSFSINLETDSGDNAFHFNPRFNEHQVVRNAKIGGNWGAEERVGGFPFQQGQPFEITIQLTSFQYKVSVNGFHFTDFNHRLSAEAVRRLTINGDVQLHAVRYPQLNPGGFGPAPPYQGMQAQPQGPGFPYGGANPQPPGYAAGMGMQAPGYAGGMGMQAPGYAGGMGMQAPGYAGGMGMQAPGYAGGMGMQAPGYAGGMGMQAPGMGSPYAGQSVPFGHVPTAAGPSAPAFNPPTPYFGPIPGGLYPGRMIRISGVGRGSRFSINLQTGTKNEANIALHVDVRFHVGNDHNVVVRNSRINGSWGGEERQAHNFPFVHNGPFEIIILVEPSAFKVAVNNQHFTDFAHRLQPLASVDCIHIDGEVHINMVQIQ